MSLTQDHGDFVFECDACHATLETNTSNFEAARNVVMRNRWRTRPAPRRNRSDAPEWQHACPDCQGDARPKDRVRASVEGREA